MSPENHTRDPQERGSPWGLLLSLIAVAAMLLAALTLYIDLHR